MNEKCSNGKGFVPNAGKHAGVQAFRARRCISMAGEGAATGKALTNPLEAQDNALLVTQQGRIVYLGPYAEKFIPVGAQRLDLGEVTLAPAAVNAHTHLQLSHLSGATLWDQGFVPWLASLIPLLARPLEQEPIEAAVGSMVDCGTAHAADYTSHGMAMVGTAAAKGGLGCTLLAEWLGYAAVEGDSPWPLKCQAVLEDVPPSALASATPCGHALYSTRPETLQRVHRWCVAHERPYVMHLAEFPEENDALLEGKGALVDLYTAASVLPEGWRAPGVRPVQQAAKLGLLNNGAMAVHCVHCNAEDVATLAAHQASVCLCPRSNLHLGVGEAPAQAMAEAGVLLCLGTDGLTSNTDLNVWNDAVFLRERGVLPRQALLRMLTVNGAAALRLAAGGCLREGGEARWAVVPDGLE